MIKIVSYVSDPHGDRLYWVQIGERDERNLKSATLNGSDVRQLLKSYTISDYYSFDVYGNYIYLTNRTLIIRINKLFEDEYKVLYNSTDSIAVIRVCQQSQGEGKA